MGDTLRFVQLGLGLVQCLFPLSHGFDQTIEAANQLADFIVSGNGQGLQRAVRIG